MNTHEKVALITGGSRGLGKNMALRMADKGYDVVITYHTQQQAADDVIAEIENKDRKAAAIQYDSSNLTALDAFINAFKNTLKNKWDRERFDFLVNNAGIGATIPFMQATENDFDKFSDIHLKSIYFLTQKLLPVMNDGGRIINISTGTTRFCVPGYSLYASMKGAIEVFTRYLAKEVGERSITANVVAPGPIETDFNNAGLRNNPERKKIMAAQTALGRTGVAEDIGGIVAFLCTEEAGWISGQRIEASGGINL